MKRFPQIDRFFTAVCSYLILVLFILLTSCEKESLQDDSLRIKAAKIETASLKTLISYDDCSASCIEEGSETFYVKSDYKSLTSNNSNNVNGKSNDNSNTKTITYFAYNTEYDFIVEVRFDQTKAESNANITINIEGNSIPFNDKDVENEETIIHSIKLPFGWEACNEIKFSINASFNKGQGIGNNQNDIDFNENYSLIGICSSSCDENFSYLENEDGSYTFTYISSEDLDNAEVKFTCPHITSFEALDDKIYSVNPGKSNGSPTVLTWAGDVTACTEMTFILAFEADCEQTNSGKANLFTDFKVNGESKKGDNANIVFQCPE